MAIEWLRLWHDMPTDPKWRVIARASKQPLSLVISLYVTLLVDASKNKSRGVTKCHDEDLAVTLDCDIEQIEAIKAAMQGRVLDGDKIKEWELRQPKREDSGNAETGAKSAAERKAEERARKKAAIDNGMSQQCHGESRNVTLDKDKDKSKHLSVSTDVDTGGRPPKVTDPNEIIFGYGLPLLTNAGTAEKQARSFLGGLRKAHGDEALIDKLRECLIENPLQPLEWLAAALPPTGVSRKRAPAVENFANRDYGKGGLL